MPDLMMSAMTKPCFKGKSKAKAQQKRTEGNRAFQLKDYEKAVRLYSAAILEAPGGNTSNNQEEGEKSVTRLRLCVLSLLYLVMLTTLSLSVATVIILSYRNVNPLLGIPFYESAPIRILGNPVVI